ncbi:MAG: DEAD/DEAH box helicase [Solirubrobacteraceae bacterium]|nr:DEAD/DEAH box helicase [Solirubrobacteraceae bacterium]
MTTETQTVTTAATTTTPDHFPPGTLVEVRDELWLVERSERAGDGGWFVDVQGLSDLVRGTNATFASTIDQIVALDPEQATVKVDRSPRFRDSRLWLEATRRKSSVPLTDPRLTVATQGLVDALPYQVAACRQALDPANLRPRILLADAVGLGKTIEIGMILSELVRRGRGERILVVTPRHVLEQMQFELWTRFALPFVRLDSVGIQRIRRRLPANRNPFAYFKRAIISIDTLKGDRYLAHLEKQAWDAVVIDESHNVTNNETQNNRVARLLSRRTDALILASATPHNGKAESFAELIRMLEPSAVRPNGELIEDEVRRLIIRRHRHSPEVAATVGADWAERQEPRNVLVPANPTEDAVAGELESSWLHPEPGRSVLSGKRARLFPWTLAKAFLSSPAALQATVAERLRKVDDEREEDALHRLADLAERNLQAGSAKYDALRRELDRIGIKRTGDARVVIFAERVATLTWLHDRLQRDLKLKDDQIRVLHGGLTDVEQQEIVESFKQASTPIRVLVTGDVASEGVNLHLQCHELIHYDIPWSLIRIEQRNGRIDRYGQKHSPRITTLLLSPATEVFGGDLRVLQRLVEKEHEAHKALGDSASLMGKYDVQAEEDAIREVLAGQQDLDDVVRSVDEVRDDGGLEGLLARLMAPADDAPTTTAPTVEDPPPGVYDEPLPFLRDALELAFTTPAAAPAAGGVGWREHAQHQVVEFEPSADLRQRLEVLPQTYLRDRRVTEGLRLATAKARGQQALDAGRSAESSSLWPEVHFLAPLHPALDWAADRALASLGRNEVFAVAVPGTTAPALLVQGTLTNARGQVVAASHLVMHFLDAARPDRVMTEPFESLRGALDALGVASALANTGSLPEDLDLSRFVAPGVREARAFLEIQFEAAADDVERRVGDWIARVGEWEEQAAELFQRQDLRARRGAVADELGLAEAMRPRERTVRPLLLVVPDGEDA